MTPTQFEQGRRRNDKININMIGTFVVFLMLPYVFFFGLLMLLTGQVDLVLLYNSVMHNHDMAVFKAWLIGLFTLASVGGFFLTAYRTEKYIADRIGQTPKPPEHTPHGGSVPTHYVIESGETLEASEATKARHSELEGVIGDPEK
jgi:hypothetical protein